MATKESPVTVLVMRRSLVEQGGGVEASPKLQTQLVSSYCPKREQKERKKHLLHLKGGGRAKMIRRHNETYRRNLYKDTVTRILIFYA